MTKKIIYIVGAGRSGTTLLDIMLGNNPDTISLGEINRFYKRLGVPPNRSQDSETYKFWNKISLGLKKKGHDNYESLNNIFYKNEYHTSFFKAIFKTHKAKYRNCLNDMYATINENIKQNVIIESSKYPSRALNMSSYIKDNGVEICYIYLKKDPVSVVSSFQKKDIEQPQKGFIAANLYYFIVNLLCEITILILKQRGHKTKTIKYKDLIDKPQNCLSDLQNRFNINQQELIEKVINKKPLMTGLLFDGNRIRLEHTIVLKNQNKKINKTFGYYFTKAFNYILYN